MLWLRAAQTLRTVVISSITSFLATSADLGTTNQSTSTSAFVNTDTTALSSSTTDTTAPSTTTASANFAPGREDEGAYGDVIQGRPLAERYSCTGMSRPEKRGPGRGAASSAVSGTAIVGPGGRDYRVGRRRQGRRSDDGLQ